MAYNGYCEITIIIILEIIYNMYLSYYQLHNETFEGIGAQYQRIIGLLAIAKYHNLKYIHIPINVGHNYDNVPEWNIKWDNMFNIVKLSDNKNININNLTKEYNPLLNINIIDDENKLYCFNNPYEIFDKNPNIYLKNIQSDIIKIYDEANNNRKLIYNKNKINIAIHIRVYNDYDDKPEYNNYANNKTERFYFTCDMYKKLIHDVKQRYLNADIHIFSQNKYFDLRYKELRKIKDLIFHFDDMDCFDTFHHLCKADILVLGLSSLSMLAGFYNKNTVIYLKYYTSPALDSWIIYNQ